MDIIFMMMFILLMRLMSNWLRDLLTNKLAKWQGRKLTLSALLPLKERTKSAKLNSLAHIIVELRMLQRMSRDFQRHMLINSSA